jgi:Domain of unknown function (DUF4328)
MAMQAELPYRLDWISGFLEAVSFGQIVFAVAGILAIGCSLFGILPSFVMLMPQLVLAFAATSLLGVIVLLIWMHHAVANAGHIAPDPRRIGRWWVVVWWFVPLFNLWQPIRSMSQTWNTSVDTHIDMNGPAAPPVTVWWLLLLFAPFPLLTSEPTALAEWHALALFLLMNAASAASLITIVRYVTRGQLAKVDEVGAVAPEGDGVPRAAL